MRAKSRGRWLAGIVCIAVAIASHDASAAKLRPGRLTARIGGRAFRAIPTSVRGVYGSTLVNFSGTTRLQRGVVRALGVSCTIDDLRAATLPVTVPCAADYVETVPGAYTSPQDWSTTQGISVTFQVVGASRVRGTFSGTIETADPNHPQDGPVSVSRGRFSVALLDSGS